MTVTAAAAAEASELCRDQLNLTKVSPELKGREPQEQCCHREEEKLSISRQRPGFRSRAPQSNLQRCDIRGGPDHRGPWEASSHSENIRQVLQRWGQVGQAHWLTGGQLAVMPRERQDSSERLLSAWRTILDRL